MDRGAWRAIVHGVTDPKSDTTVRLSSQYIPITAIFWEVVFLRLLPVVLCFPPFYGVICVGRKHVIVKGVS